jgi:hypothetical protein
MILALRSSAVPPLRAAPWHLLMAKTSKNVTLEPIDLTPQ